MAKVIWRRLSANSAPKASVTPTRGAVGTIRTRLVAFGRASEVGLNVVPIGIILEAVTDLLEHYDDVLRSAKLSSPAAETLKLLKKTGFEISRDS